MPLPHTDYSLKTIDKHDLPRERLRRLGANALKTEELVALFCAPAHAVKMFYISQNDCSAKTAGLPGWHKCR